MRERGSIKKCRRATYNISFASAENQAATEAAAETAAATTAAAETVTAAAAAKARPKRSVRKVNEGKLQPPFPFPHLPALPTENVYR